MQRQSLQTRLRALLLPRGPISTVEADNIWNLFREMAFWGVAAGTYLSYLSVFAVRLGATDFWVGTLSSGPALVGIFWLLPAGRFMERQRRQVPLLRASILLARFLILPMALIPWLLPTYGGQALALLVVLQAFPSGLGNVALTTALPECVSRAHLARFFSQRNAIFGLTSTLGTLVSVPILAALDTPINYQVVFFIGFVAAMLSVFYLRRLQVPDRVVRPAQRPVGRRRLRLPFLSVRAMRGAWQGQPAYSWYVLAAFVFHWGLYAAIPLFPIYWVRVLQLSDIWIGILTVVFGAVTVVGALMAPRAIRRWGNGPVLTFSAATLAIYPLGTALSRSPYPLILVCIAGGIVSALMSVTLFNRLIEVVPAARRPSYVGLYNAIINVAIFAAPLVSTSLIDHVGLVPLMFVGAGIRVLGGLMFALSRGEAKEIPEDSPMSVPPDGAVAASQGPAQAADGGDREPPTL